MQEAQGTLILAAASVVSAGLVASKELVTRFLGPSADYLGAGTLEVIKKCEDNAGRIFNIAFSKAKMDQPGQVNPRVLKNLLDEGRFVEDAISAEYFGGVLASSRTQDGTDDTALPMVTLLKSMSADQIRLHYIVYFLLSQKTFDPAKDDSAQFLDGLELKIVGNELLRSMACKGIEGEARLALAISGLSANGLIGPSYALRLGGLITGNQKPPGDDSIVLQPTKQGASLFLRALGLRGLLPEVITSVEASASLSDAVKGIEIPESPKWHYRKRPDPFSGAKEELEVQIADLEFTVEDLKSQLEDIQEKVAAKLEEQVSELEDTVQDVKSALDSLQEKVSETAR